MPDVSACFGLTNARNVTDRPSKREERKEKEKKYGILGIPRRSEVRARASTRSLQKSELTEIIPVSVCREENSRHAARRRAERSAASEQAREKRRKR